MNDIEGLVISFSEINEADALLHVLTAQGKVTLKAKGILKVNSKNARGCQLYTHSMFHLLQSNAKTTHVIKNVDVIHSYRMVREDLLKQTLACCMMEALDKINIRETELDLNECCAYLQALETSRHPYCVFSLFLCMILRLSGIALWSDSCVICNTKQSICAVSLKEGGFIYKDCFKPSVHRHFPAEKLRQLRYLTHADLKQLPLLESYGPWEYDIVEVLLGMLELHGEFKMNGAAFLGHLNVLN